LPRAGLYPESVSTFVIAYPEDKVRKWCESGLEKDVSESLAGVVNSELSVLSLLARGITSAYQYAVHHGVTPIESE